MIPPIPPADNLYKFTAITGAILVVAAVLGFFHVMTTIQNELRSEIREDKDKFEDNLVKLFSNIKEEDRKSFAELQERYVHQRWENTKSLEKQRIHAINFAWVCEIATIILGGFMIISGGRNWYFRVQVPQDNLLTIQLEKEKLELQHLKAKN